jgi:hypothetical protein
VDVLGTMINSAPEITVPVGILLIREFVTHGA